MLRDEKTTNASEHAEFKKLFEPKASHLVLKDNTWDRLHLAFNKYPKAFSDSKIDIETSQINIPFTDLTHYQKCDLACVGICIIISTKSEICFDEDEEKMFFYSNDTSSRDILKQLYTAIQQVTRIPVTIRETLVDEHILLDVLGDMVCEYAIGTKMKL